MLGIRKEATDDGLREALAAGYLTNGRELYRVHSILRGSHGIRGAYLENCRTLAVGRWTIEELERAALHPVSAQPAGEISGEHGRDARREPVGAA